MWNNGEITWEPAKHLREDSTDEFALHLRNSGLSDLEQCAWAEDHETASSQQDEVNSVDSTDSNSSKGQDPVDQIDPTLRNPEVESQERPKDREDEDGEEEEESEIQTPIEQPVLVKRVT